MTLNTSIISDVVGQVRIIQGSNIKNPTATTEVVVGLLLDRDLDTHYIKPFSQNLVNDTFKYSHIYLQIKNGPLDDIRQCVCSI